MASLVPSSLHHGVHSKENGPIHLKSQKSASGGLANRAPLGQKSFGGSKAPKRMPLGNIKNIQPGASVQSGLLKSFAKPTPKEYVDNVEAWPKQTAQSFSYRAADVAPSAASFLKNIGKTLGQKKRVIDVDESIVLSGSGFDVDPIAVVPIQVNQPMNSYNKMGKSGGGGKGILGSLISDLNDDLSDLSSDDSDEDV